jgi:protein involved in polysaccharide export with SLBB domain
MKLHSFKYVLVALVLAATAGCASYAEYGGVPTLEDNVRLPPTPPPYRIEAGDQLQVRFYRNPELDQLVVVRPDGYVSLPFVDDVRVAGKTPGEVDTDLTQRYRGELAVPDVSVIVQTFGGQRIYVGGEVRAEGVHPLAGGLTLYQAIDQAGGFLDTAHRRQVVLIRRGSDGIPVGHSVDLRDVEHGIHPERDVVLQPYDVVYVPKSKIGNLDLWVDQYIRQLLPINPSSAIRYGVY